MKKLLLSIIVFISTGASAQLLYQLDTFHMNYQEMNSGTDVSSAAWDSSQMVTLPFGFKYFDKQYNNLHISNYGVFFTDTGSDLFFFGLDDFIPQDLDIQLSPITFDITGDIGDQIVMVQYKNINEANADTGKIYTLNLQIWLFEKDNSIELHFGNSVINDPKYNRFDIGLDNEDGSYRYGVTGNADAPILVEVDNNYTGISGFPTSGLVYRFEPKNWSSIAFDVNEKHMFGSTGDGFVFKDDSKVELRVFDLNGKVLNTYSYDNQEGLKHYQLEYSTGIYLLEIRLDNSILYEKILIGQ